MRQHCYCLHIKRSCYPTKSSVHPVLVLILHIYPREIQILWSDYRVNQTVAMRQGKASEMLAYRVQQHSTKKQARHHNKKKKEGKKNERRKMFKTKRTTGVLRNVMQENQKGKAARWNLLYRSIHTRYMGYVCMLQIIGEKRRLRVETGNDYRQTPVASSATGIPSLLDGVSATRLPFRKSTKKATSTRARAT